jgi:hypothetical protein
MKPGVVAEPRKSRPGLIVRPQRRIDPAIDGGCRQRRRWQNARMRDIYIFPKSWKDFGGFDAREADDADDGE